MTALRVQIPQVRVTFYRDNHAWCPYCQKVWLFLEEKRIPYFVEKVAMKFYGEKQEWYKQKVQSGLVPALEIHGMGLVTDSDVIIAALEQLWRVAFFYAY